MMALIAQVDVTDLAQEADPVIKEPFDVETTQGS